MSNFFINLFKMKMDIRSALGLLTILFSFSALFVLMFHPIPKENTHLVDTSIGFLLGGAVTGVMGYFFSESMKDKEKVGNVE